MLEPSTGTKRLVGYVTPASVETVPLLDHCRGRLVAAMVPSLIVAMDDFPLLPNGKVDVRALPAPDWAAESTAAYVAPSDELEETLQRIWTEALRLPEPMGVATDFFAAGGTSLQVFRVAAAMQAELKLPSVPPTLIHSHRTIAATAAALRGLQASGGLAAGPVARAWPGSARTLSANQEQMWVLYKNMGASSTYNVPIGLRLAGRVDQVAMQAALNAVAAHQESLRCAPPSLWPGYMFHAGSLRCCLPLASRESLLRHRRSRAP